MMGEINLLILWVLGALALILIMVVADILRKLIIRRLRKMIIECDICQKKAKCWTYNDPNTDSAIRICMKCRKEIK